MQQQRAQVRVADHVDTEHLVDLPLMPGGGGQHGGNGLQDGRCALQDGVTPYILQTTLGGATEETDHHLDLIRTRPVDGGEQIEAVEAIGHVASNRVGPGLPAIPGGRPGHAGATRETSASTSASGRGGQPGTYVDTGITRSTPFVTE